LCVCAIVTGEGSCTAWAEGSAFSVRSLVQWLKGGSSLFEGFHRLLSVTVPGLSLILALWVQRSEPRSWVRCLAWTSLGIVLVQALLGALGASFGHGLPMAIAHAVLAQGFFALTATVAWITSPGWQKVPRVRGNSFGLIRGGVFTTCAVGFQIFLGAVTRHSGAGLAIPDFPLSFGHLMPPEWSPLIFPAFLHRTFAYLVTVSVLYSAYEALKRFPEDRYLARPALAMGFLVLTQFALGVIVVLGHRNMIPTSLHVVLGAVLFAACLALTLSGSRVKEGRVQNIPFGRIKKATVANGSLHRARR